MKTWEIYRYIYGNAYEDPYCEKSSKHEIIGFVTDTEENVKSLVERLNQKNNSYYAKDEPEDEWDVDYLDENYITYVEFHTTTVKEIESRYGV